MRTVLRLTTVFGLLLGAGLFALSCGGGGGGDPLTLEEYFQELDVAENDFRAAQDESGAAFAALDDTTPVEDVVDLLAELRDVVDEFVANLDDIDPPPEAEAAHNETMGGFQVVSESIGDAVDSIDSDTTADEIFAIFQEPEVVEAETALDASCNALQTLADDNNIEVDLSCQD